MTIEIYYWPIRGLASHILNIAEYVQADYVFKPLDKGIDHPKWGEMKATLFGDEWNYANLPYMIDTNNEETKKNPLTETNAIIMYICLHAGNDQGKELAKVYEKDPVDYIQMAGIIHDIKMSITIPAYMSPDMVAFKAAIVGKYAAFDKKLTGINKRFDDGRQWLFGNSISLTDFYLCEILENMQRIDVDLEIEGIAKFKNLGPYVERFTNLERIKAYRSREDFMHKPFNNYQAIWK